MDVSREYFRLMFYEGQCFMRICVTNPQILQKKIHSQVNDHHIPANRPKFVTQKR